MRLIFAFAIWSLWTNAAAAQTFDREGWRSDLRAMKAAVEQKYANLDWLRTEREVDVDALFARAEAALDRTASDAEGRALLEQTVRRFNDGHVTLRWPSTQPPSPAAAPTPPGDAEALCAQLGYRTTLARAGTGAALPGYRPLSPGPVPTGMVTVGPDTLGILRIGEFSAQGSSELCQVAVAALKLNPAAPCDSACDNQVVTEVYRRLGGALVAAATTLKAHGATVLLVDISGNGGGSEWVEAAARTLTSVRLSAALRMVVRGPRWSRLLREEGERLREAAGRERGATRAMLLRHAAAVEESRDLADQPCAASTPCPRLIPAGYATGPIAAAAPGDLPDREWAVHLFSPSQHSYREGAWNGPLIVLADNETWSAAEQFAAELQDNRAAVIVGTRTGGSGCGYSWGGDPTPLPHSGATLMLPDCVRLRADGSNEVRGVLPDIAVPMRASDGTALRGRLTAARLTDAIVAARALQARRQ